jgi:hypothetical protein
LLSHSLWPANTIIIVVKIYDKYLGYTAMLPPSNSALNYSIVLYIAKVFITGLGLRAFMVQSSEKITRG